MRTQAEIVEWYRHEQHNDLLGFTAQVVLPYLPVEQLREFCKSGADLSDWEADPLTERDVLEAMRLYMKFAWGKVQNHRGISANRSVLKMSAWLWLLGDEEMVAFCEAHGNYAQYGAPILKAICDKYGFPIPENPKLERMIRGLPCIPGCDEGCGGR